MAETWDPSWVEHGRELVAKIRQDFDAKAFFLKTSYAPNVYLCGPDVPGLIAYVDSLIENHRRCAERNGDMVIKVIEATKERDAEREACAKLCEEAARNDTGAGAGEWLAERIRARGKEAHPRG